MIHLSTGLRLGVDQAPLEQLAQTCRYLDITTICSATQLDWTDKDVTRVRRFLDAQGLRIGEFSRFHHGLASRDRAENDQALAAYRQHLAHAGILGATCVGFSLTVLYSLDGSSSGEDPRSAAVWERAVATIGELASAAEAAGMDIAAHPHQLGPLHSVEQIERLQRDVNSPRLKVLLDPVNLVTLDTYHNTAPFLGHMFDALGGDIVSVHAKDTALSGLQRNDQGLLTVCRLDEAVPGKGNLDYATLLRRANALDHDVVLNVEHLSKLDDKVVALHNIRHVAGEQGITLA
ncbi:MAG: hypothetical protein CL878_14990 [Dehalococcoidia bacterium]|nr:hypothetical protein [Dehalococcoidia bacterium]